MQSQTTFSGGSPAARSFGITARDGFAPSGQIAKVRQFVLPAPAWIAIIQRV